MKEIIIIGLEEILNIKIWFEMCSCSDKLQCLWRQV